MRKFKIIILILIFLISCNSVTTQQPDKTNIHIELISKIPKEFDGCIVSYSLSESKLENSQYIFIDGWDGVKSQFCYVKINGVLERLDLTEEKKGTDPRNYTNRYSNEKYSLTLSVKYLRQAGYDSYYNKAQLTISTTSTDGITLKLIGLCSC